VGVGVGVGVVRHVALVGLGRRRMLCRCGWTLVGVGGCGKACRVGGAWWMTHVVLLCAMVIVTCCMHGWMNKARCLHGGDCVACYMSG
jgi:hypothetical protein